VLKGRSKGLYLRGEIYWFAKQANGRRSMVSLETRDYAEAVQRAREILDGPELMTFAWSSGTTRSFGQMTARL